MPQIFDNSHLRCSEGNTKKKEKNRRKHQTKLRCSLISKKIANFKRDEWCSWPLHQAFYKDERFRAPTDTHASLPQVLPSVIQTQWKAWCSGCSSPPGLALHLVLCARHNACPGSSSPKLHFVLAITGVALSSLLPKRLPQGQAFSRPSCAAEGTWKLLFHGFSAAPLRWQGGPAPRRGGRAQQMVGSQA